MPKRNWTFYTWLSGFVDGEGNFMIGIEKSKSNRFGYHIRPRFLINLHEKDRAILEEICRFLGVGEVVLKSYNSARIKGKQSDDQYTFRVRNISDCLYIRTIFEKYPLRTTKKRDFELWSKALDIINEKQHLTIRGFFEIAKIRDQMNASLLKKPYTYRTRVDFIKKFEKQGYLREGDISGT